MAVYTPLSDDDVSVFLQGYDLGAPVSCKGIAEGVENSNFLLTLNRPDRGECKAILTVYEKRVNPADLPFFLGYMEWIAQRGVPCPLPLHARDGSVVRELKGKSAAIVSFLEGASCKAIRNEHMALLGEKLAAMHKAGEGFALTRANALSITGWRPLFDKFSARADEITSGLTRLIDDELDFLESRWPQNLPQGIIHADLFPDNVFFRDTDAGMECSGLIDYYFACRDLLAYDLAICLNAWCFEVTHEFNITRARHLLRAYNETRRMLPDELEALPILARGSALRFLLTRAHDWLFRVEGALVKPKDPMEYVAKLRFHRQVKAHGEYGL